MPAATADHQHEDEHATREGHPSSIAPNAQVGVAAESHWRCGRCLDCPDRPVPAHALEHHGSDLLIVAGAPPTVRIDGELRPIGGEEVMSADATEKLIFEVLGTNLTAAAAGRSRDRLLVRVGVAGALPRERVLPAGQRRPRAPTDPARDPVVRGARPAAGRRAAGDDAPRTATRDRAHRLGKSTTLASIVKYISEHRACHILTIEDPIEFHHQHSSSIITQREIGADSKSFAQRVALRAA